MKFSYSKYNKKTWLVRIGVGFCGFIIGLVVMNLILKEKYPMPRITSISQPLIFYLFSSLLIIIGTIINIFCAFDKLAKRFFTFGTIISTCGIINLVYIYSQSRQWLAYISLLILLAFVSLNGKIINQEKKRDFLKTIIVVLLLITGLGIVVIFSVSFLLKLLSLLLIIIPSIAILWYDFFDIICERRKHNIIHRD